MGRQIAPHQQLQTIYAFFAIVLLVTAQPVSRPVVQIDGPVYIVQPGDTLYTIALAFGVSVDDLLLTNNIGDPSLLGIGQALTIPGYEDISGTLTTRPVAPGDSLATLALALDTTPEVLIRLNRMTNPALLYVGQPLIYLEIEEGAGLAEGQVITVAPGDTLLGLAARYNQHPRTLMQLNNLEHPALLFPGQQLVVPLPDRPLNGLASPLETLELKPEHPKHGHPVGITVQVEPGTTITGLFGERELNFATLDDTHQIALQGIYAFDTPGLYPLEINATAADGRVASYRQYIQVGDANYEYQQIYVDDATAGLLSPDIVIPERDHIAETARPFNPVRYWEGDWIAPVPMERQTAPFGIRRSYNNGPYDSFHGGLDLGGSSETPIAAPAAGVVVLAERLQVRGNAVIIDHGWGVYTGYWHMSSMLVAPGQQVTAGQQLGFIGSTGLSTGNHLHWEVWVGGVQTDPLAWLEYQYP